MILKKIEHMSNVSSSGVGRSQLQIFRNNVDLHVLHWRHNDAGRSHLFDTGLGDNGIGDVCSVPSLLWLHFGFARVTAMAVGPWTIGRGLEDFGSYGQS